MESISNIFQHIISGKGLAVIFYICLSLGILKILTYLLKFKGGRKRASIKERLVTNGIGSIIMFAAIIFCMKVMLLPWLLDMPYIFSGEEPYYYGETIGDYDEAGKAGVKNTDTGEILYIKDWMINNGYKGDFKEYELEKGTYVEIKYLPHTKWYTLVSSEEEAEYNEIDRGEDYTLKKVNEKIEVYGVVIGVIGLFLYSSLSSKYMLKRLKKQRITEESTEVVRYGMLNGISILLSSMPPLFAVLAFIGSWMGPLSMEQGSLIIWICMLAWIIGILLEAISYHTMLIFGKEEFYIGTSKFLQKKYQKCDIQSVERTKGSSLEIAMENGEKIKGRAEKEGFEIIRAKLL